MGRIRFAHTYEDIISVDNILASWREFLRGKRKREGVQAFQLHLMDNVLRLHRELADRAYTHGEYEQFCIADPKSRLIHKASVRDRLVHHCLYRKLYPFFDRTFIADSYSCRKLKGAHKALDRFRRFFWKVSQNNTRTCWVLKCDIKKCFASIDHAILKSILAEYIPDWDIRQLLAEVIDSFHTNGENGVGLPLGNLTSQLFVNIYLNEFDQFIKHTLKGKCYIRYADDFVLLSNDKTELEQAIPQIRTFLYENLCLQAHKVSIQTYASGVDYLGWVHFPTHRVLRTKTKKKMFARMKGHPTEATLQSYLGLLSYGDTYKLQKRLVRMYENTSDVQPDT